MVALDNVAQKHNFLFENAKLKIYYEIPINLK